MTRTLFSLALAILAVAICAPGVEAAPVTVTTNAEAITFYTPPLADDLLDSGTLSDGLSELALAGFHMTGGGMSRMQPAPKPEPEPEPQPKPAHNPQQHLVGLAANPSQGPAGSTMSSTSVTSLGSSPSSVPPADLCITPDLLPATSGEVIATSDWLFIPPRFLDGVFRPPRHVVSL